jgi:hypothetical protein
MRNSIIILVIIFTSLSACKDDCLTCPDNEAVVNGECQCIGISFNGECKNKNEFFDPNTYNGPLINDPTVINVLLSGAEDTIKSLGFNGGEFDFIESSIKLFMFPLDWYNNRYRSFCLIETIRDGGEPYYCDLTSPIGREYSDTVDYYWPSAYEYEGLISQAVKAPGFEPATHYTTEIDGETCYLRPYIKILDKDYIRVTFRYVTKDEEVKAECVRLFHK